MKSAASLSVLFLACLVPLSAQATDPHPSGIREEIAQDLAEARQEVRTDLARERAELDSEDLSLNDSLHFGSESRKERARRRALPEAAITPKGDFLVTGEPVAIDARQRRRLLDYRRQVIDLARLGIDGGEKAAMAAIDASDASVFSLLVGGLTGSLERRIEASTRRHIEPFVQQMCKRLPQLMDSQQALAASLPEFRPYASLDADDVRDCEGEVGRALASR